MTKAQRTALATILTQAEARGREAFKEGRKSAPFYDMKALEPMIKAAGETTTKRAAIKVMDAWTSGWTKEMLAQPIPGMPEWKSVWA
jgi:hypothetical protein